MSASYLLCATPRTGSTLLCSLLASTGVLGRPESFFRGADEASWAERLGLPHDGSRVPEYRAFTRSVRAHATSDSGVFGARIMWGSLDRLVTGLEGSAHRTALAVLHGEFGPLHFVHLWREDVLSQAVSWCRAEQTGFWQMGDTEVRPPKKDVDRMKELVGTIHEHNAAWHLWFDSQGVRPHTVTYDQLVRDPRGTVGGIAALVEVEIPERWRPTSPPRQQADALNAEWAAALEAALQTAELR